MRRIVLVMPDLFGGPEDQSVVRQGPEGVPGLLGLRELGSVTVLGPMRTTVAHEAAWLGLDEETVKVAPGPLTLSALKVDPPERSVSMHVTLAGAVDGVLQDASYVPEASDLRPLLQEAERLKTSDLFPAFGDQVDHGLIWLNGSLDLGLTEPVEAIGKELRVSLPQGDGEKMLRRFIDDSINLLTDHELNRKRADNGLPPLNVLWPWGPGFTPHLPNLALERGETVWCESGSMRLAGLARLVGYRHGPWQSFVQGLNVPWSRILRDSLERPATVIVVELASELRKLNRMEELAWLVRRMDEDFLGPIAAELKREPMRLAIVAPSSCPNRLGLGLTSETGQRSDDSTPFDERALEEGPPIRMRSANLIEEALKWSVE
ncbi:MAG: hypothetical protein HONBIEJF_01599 [Fimbriimonadaceae bacterium]|nr:hypothetical protein [Fimbriimonadaceae bacterium]